MNRTTMKNVMTRVAGSMAIGLLAVGVFGSPQALAGISATKHNLGSGGTGSNVFGGTAELCVFCHTPHGADTSASVPLWNRALGSQTYTTYNSLGTSSLDGTTAPVGSVSIACLSCHDGNTAMNTVINAPGSGGYAAAGAAMPGAWTRGASKITGVAMIGTDLQNDHPIGIQYGGGPSSGNVPTATGTASTYANTAFKDADFKSAQALLINSKSVWWVDAGSGGTGTREKQDMQLYTRTGAVGVGTGGATLAGDQPFVECASCHDPHTENVTFLRIANTGSAVCLACHTK